VRRLSGLGRLFRGDNPNGYIHGYTRPAQQAMQTA
jgi:hypothetical protein